MKNAGQKFYSVSNFPQRKSIYLSIFWVFFFFRQSSLYPKNSMIFSFSVQSLRKSRRIQKMDSADVPPSDADTGTSNFSPGTSSGKRKSPSCRHRGHTHQRPKGPQRPPQDYMQTNEYRKMPKKTGATRTRERRGAVVTCFVCLQRILGTNTSSHLSSAHGFTRQLTRYLLDIERIRRQQSPDLLNVQDCVTCLRRFIACSSHCHKLPECVMVDVPDYMEPDSLCEQAKIIKTLCGGGQPTPRRSTETMRAAYEKLKKLFEGE